MRRLALLGVLCSILYAAALAIPDWGRELGRFAPILACLTAAYLLAALALLRSVRLGEGDARRTLIVMWLGAVAFRGLVAAAPPTLSDDVFRYVWDGRVLLEGVNPYRYAPSAEALAPLRDASWGRINNPDLPTIYPPLLMLVFAGAAFVSPTVLAWKLTAAGFDLLGGFFLMQALAASGRPRAWALLLLWHPLPVIEFAGNGHADSVGICLLAFAFWMAARHRWLSAGIGATLAGLVKFAPWALLPALMLRLRLWWLLLPALAAAFYLPFEIGNVSALGSLGIFAKTWRANDFLFGFFAGNDPAEAALLAAKWWAVAIVLLVWGLATASRRPLPSLFGWVFGAALLVSPVVHPWYVAWLLPAAILARHPAWWVWSLTVPLAYAPLPAFLSGRGWTESAGLKAIEYLPVFCVLPFQFWMERKSEKKDLIVPGSRPP